jgi:hypothetical protein
MKNNLIVKIFTGILSIYLAFSSIILSEIILHDIILNAYKSYSFTKVQTTNFINKAENIEEKWKILVNKLFNKDKAKEIEQKLKEKQLKEEKELNKLKENLKFKEKVLFLLPYIIGFIIFLISYVKLYKITQNFINIFKNK